LKTSTTKVMASLASLSCVRIAFVGKGGAGKSVLAGTFARALARRGEPVLAVDSDPMPGLAFSIGLRVDDAPIPDEAVEEKPEGESGPRYRLRCGLSAVAAVERYAAHAPDGVRFLQFGKLHGHVRTLMRSQFAFRQIMSELPSTEWHVVGDLPGGTRQPFAGWGDYAETVLVVVQPSAASLLAARRLAGLARGNAERRVFAVANRVREAGDADYIERRCGLAVVGAVPWDNAFAAADRAGAAPIDLHPASAAVRAVESLVNGLVEERAR